ncbi:MAG: hypothetical protein FWH40_06615 [Coriobacteriia bacterium]|nr:hypothetical protein [Coriobacteriia bacterium]
MDKLQISAVDQLLSQLPDKVGFFEGSEYPMPIKTTFLGETGIDPKQLADQLQQKQNGDVRDLLEPVLLAAELVESVNNDKELFFIADKDVRSYVFNSKWKSGWVLLLGTNKVHELAAAMFEKEFLIFTDQPDIANTVYIGSHDTAPIYFLQMMVRYGLIWGRILPGDDHEMGHFLERDMPGYLLISEDLSPLKYLIVLGLMKLGAPAVVPSTFPFPYGNKALADTFDDQVDYGLHFPNLRTRYYRDELVSLPDYLNIANVNETFEVAKTLGGNSLLLRKASGVEAGTTVFSPHDSKPSEAGPNEESVSILIEVDDDLLTQDLEAMLEQTALRSINYIGGLRASETAGVLQLETSGEAFDFVQIAEAISGVIRLTYPRLGYTHVFIRQASDTDAPLAAAVQAHKRERSDYISSMTEENTDLFTACTECRAFSQEHTCLITPERMPMCAARTYASTKAAGLFGSSVIPFQRQSENDLLVRQVFEKGRLIDAARGEYEGCNSKYAELTGGRLNRVFLHSLRDYPHTSCGCFQNLAFWIENVQGIGIMSRNSQAVTPQGWTWDLLANRAGGKQSDGITGVSIDYILSARFLEGDGGLSNVVWMDSKLLAQLEDKVPTGQRIATEADVSTPNELRQFVGRL